MAGSTCAGLMTLLLQRIYHDDTSGRRAAAGMIGSSGAGPARLDSFGGAACRASQPYAEQAAGGPVLPGPSVGPDSQRAAPVCSPQAAPAGAAAGGADAARRSADRPLLRTLSPTLTPVSSGPPAARSGGALTPNPDPTTLSLLGRPGYLSVAELLSLTPRRSPADRRGARSAPANPASPVPCSSSAACSLPSSVQSSLRAAGRGKPHSLHHGLPACARTLLGTVAVSGVCSPAGSTRSGEHSTAGARGGGGGGGGGDESTPQRAPAPALAAASLQVVGWPSLLMAAPAAEPQPACSSGGPQAVPPASLGAARATSLPLRLPLAELSAFAASAAADAPLGSPRGASEAATAAAGQACMPPPPPLPRQAEQPGDPACPLSRHLSDRAAEVAVVLAGSVPAACDAAAGAQRAAQAGDPAGTATGCREGNVGRCAASAAAAVMAEIPPTQVDDDALLHILATGTCAGAEGPAASPGGALRALAAPPLACAAQKEVTVTAVSGACPDPDAGPLGSGQHAPAAARAPIAVPDAEPCAAEAQPHGASVVPPTAAQASMEVQPAGIEGEPGLGAEAPMADQEAQPAHALLVAQPPTELQPAGHEAGLELGPGAPLAGGASQTAPQPQEARGDARNDNAHGEATGAAAAAAFAAGAAAAEGRADVRACFGAAASTTPPAAIGGRRAGSEDVSGPAREAPLGRSGAADLTGQGDGGAAAPPAPTAVPGASAGLQVIQAGRGGDTEGAAAETRAAQALSASAAGAAGAAVPGSGGVAAAAAACGEMAPPAHASFGAGAPLHAGGAAASTAAADRAGSPPGWPGTADGSAGRAQALGGRDGGCLEGSAVGSQERPGAEPRTVSALLELWTVQDDRGAKPEYPEAEGKERALEACQLVTVRPRRCPLTCSGFCARAGKWAHVQRNVNRPLSAPALGQ